MTLSDFEAAGAYVVAGFLDVYSDAGHKRLGQLTAGGDLVLTPAGEAFVAERAAAAAPEAAAPEIPAVKPAAKRAKAKPDAAAPAGDVPPADDLGSELGDLAASLGS